MTEPYHYLESGLDTVWLRNGFTIRDDPQGRVVFFADLDGLHRAIGRDLVDGKRLLTGPEFRFLRLEMIKSQANLGRLIGVSVETIAHWETGKTRVDLSADKLLRLLYREKTDGNVKVERLLKRIADLDEDTADSKQMLFEETDGWDRAA